MTVRHLQRHTPRYGYAADRELTAAGLMIFFFVIFDGILMYLAPIVITGAGISESAMGLILGSSSVAGMIFDAILCRWLKQTHYRRMFLFMFVLAFSFPVFLFGGTTITFYLLAMAVWGFYYDFFNIGTIDFVERTTDPEKYASHFGILSSFQGFGYLLAPFAGSLLLLYFQPGPRMLAALAGPLGIAFIFYLAVIFDRDHEREGYAGVSKKNPFTLLKEAQLWEKIWRVLFSVLLLTLTLNMIDAAVWTFGPLFSQQLGLAAGVSGGILMTAYALPPILVGWIIGRISRRFGNMRTAQWSIIIGSAIMICVGFAAVASTTAVGDAPIPLLVALIFAASFFWALGWPAISAIYGEHIEKGSAERKEVETLQDLFTNLGDIAGPILGGYLAQYVGFARSFVAVGIAGIAVGAFLMIKRGQR